MNSQLPSLTSIFGLNDPKQFGGSIDISMMKEFLEFDLHFGGTWQVLEILFFNWRLAQSGEPSIQRTVLVGGRRGFNNQKGMAKAGFQIGIFKWCLTV